MALRVSGINGERYVMSRFVLSPCPQRNAVGTISTRDRRKCSGIVRAGVSRKAELLLTSNGQARERRTSEPPSAEIDEQIGTAHQVGQEQLDRIELPSRATL